MAKHHRAGLKRATAIDLFCGAGGLTVGLKQARFQVVGAVDLDEVAVATYRRNNRRIHVWNEDIRHLSGASVMRQLNLKRGDLDLLAGCPPCQGFSTMRTLNRGSSVHDDRNDLVLEFLRFVRVLLPKSVMLENVPGLAIDTRMKLVCDGLTKLGYRWQKRVVNAAHYGVPQRRRRMLLLASRNGGVTIPVGTANKVTVRDAISHLPAAGKSGDPMHDVGERRAPRIIDLIRRIPRDGGSRTALLDSEQLTCHKKTDGFYDVYGRMAWDNVAPTITSGCTNPSKGRFLHPSEDRAITLREAALLQTFPERYQFSMKRGKEHAAALIGNALPPRMIKTFAAAVQKNLKIYNHSDLS